MCRHIYDWNIVNCDVKQPIYLTLPYLLFQYDQVSNKIQPGNLLPKDTTEYV